VTSPALSVSPSSAGAPVPERTRRPRGGAAHAIRIVIVDDHTVFRSGLRVALEGTPDIEIVGEASGGQDAVRQALELHPDLVLMDLHMRGGGGIEATRTIRGDDPSVKVLLLGDFEDLNLAHQAAAAGATGYLSKDLSAADLITAIRSARHRRAALTPGATGPLVGAPAGAGGEPTRRQPYGLSARELEILTHVVQGFSDKEIAARLFLSQSTIKSHLRAMYRKLHLRNRVEVTAYVVKHGLLRIDAAPPADRSASLATHPTPMVRSRAT